MARKIILYITMSLDGYIARLGGEVDWLFTDQDYGYGEFLTTIDTVILGRKTYEQVLTFGDYPYAELKSYVLTRQSDRVPAAPVEFVSSRDLSWVDRLHQAEGKDIWLVGGADVVQLFLSQGWIDQIMLFIHPLILGEGIPLFKQQEQTIGLQLIDTEVYDSGMVKLVYSRR